LKVFKICSPYLGNFKYLPFRRQCTDSLAPSGDEQFTADFLKNYGSFSQKWDKQHKRTNRKLVNILIIPSIDGPIRSKSTHQSD
tara:strand:- start:137 stop:388 length:252 start_codon:yes stop_codon:yes gene_type:complete